MRMYITLVRPLTGSMLRFCRWVDPHDPESLFAISDSLEQEYPGWWTLEVCV